MFLSAARISDGGVTFGGGSASVVFKASSKVHLSSPTMLMIASALRGLFLGGSRGVSSAASLASATDEACAAAIDHPSYVVYPLQSCATHNTH